MDRQFHVRSCAAAVIVGMIEVMFATGAAGQVTPISQDRSLSVSTSASTPGCTPDADADSVAALDFSAWIQSRSVSSSTCSASATAGASQSSRINGRYATVQADATFFGPGRPETSSFSANAASLFSYTFTVDVNTPYFLSGNGNHATSPSFAVLARSETRLTRGATVVYSYQYMGFGTSPFRTSGTLTPGTYTLSVRSSLQYSSIDRFSAGGVASTFAQFWVGTECPPDVNADGVLNSQDFFDFLQAFLMQMPTADFNADDFIDSQDYFDFVNAFFRGC